MSVPAHRAQYMTVSALPTATITITGTVRAAASKAIHLPSTRPKGGMIIMITPMTVMTAVVGILEYRPRISSMSRLSMVCSIAPTQRNRRALTSAWNTMSIVAAVRASGVFNPAQAKMRPRLLMVEYARTFLPLLCPTASAAPARKLTAPKRATHWLSKVPCMAGASRTTR